MGPAKHETSYKDAGKTLRSRGSSALAPSNTWFIFVLAFLIVDYGRPQDVLPIVGIIRPGLLVLAILALYLIRNRAALFVGERQIGMIWLFIALLAIHVPFSRNEYYAYLTFSGMAKFMPFILSLVVCLNSVNRLRTFMKVYIGVMVYVALYALTHRGMGSGNYFHDENDLSLYINMVLPFCYFLFLEEKTKALKLFYAFALIVGLLAVLISFSRGGFVGLVVMFFIVWLVSPRKLLTTSLIVILGVAAYIYSGDTYRQEMATVTDTKESTANARLMSWLSGWDMFVDNPLGVGGNNFQVRFPEYQGDRFSRNMWGRVAHSLWFTLLPELGIFGVLVYFRLLLFNVKDCFLIKRRSRESTEDDKYLNAMGVAFLASLAGFFASASFISVLYYPHYWYLTAVIVATVKLRGVSAAGGRDGPNLQAPLRVSEGASSGPSGQASQ